MKKIIRLIKDPFLIYSILVHKYIKNNAHFLSDKCYLTLLYIASFRKFPNWKNPQTFNEKLQWLKLYNRNPLYSTLVDKYEVKRYVAKKIGEEYIIPTLGVWDSFEDIDFNSLPNQFVLKCTHDSGGLVIVKDKSNLDVNAAKEKIEKSLKRNFFWQGREWPYKNVKPRIIAEKYMSDIDDTQLTDYKVHNFNGIPKVILVCRDRYSESGLTEDFYNVKWEHLDITRPGHAQSLTITECPKELDEILRLSKLLAKDIPFVRSDFYIINGKEYFGELTFFPASGMKPFEPKEWDYKLGSWIELPSKR